jgi:hypothetical protein
MNKIIYILSAFILVTLFTACDPIVDSIGVSNVVTSADQITSTITPVMYKTYKTNKVKVHCTSPVLCQWSGGPTTYISNDTTVLLFGKGAQSIKLIALAADGTQLTKTYSVTVDSMYYPVPKEWGLFCGTGSKTWVWATDVTSTYFPGSAAGKCYGNGGYLGNNAPGWWTNGLTDLQGWGVADDEMTFDMNGAANFTLVTGNTQIDAKGVKKGLQAGTYKGIFSFDMTKTTVAAGTTSATAGSPWAIGQLTLVGATISLGYQPNLAGYPAIYTYDILYLDNNVMVLEIPEPGSAAWGTAWYWVFKRKGFTF